MELTVDLDLCMGFAECMVRAPRSFEWIEGVRQSRAVAEPGDPVEDITAAVRACPNGAISFEPDAGSRA
jgi:ferredoxin